MMYHPRRISHRKPRLVQMGYPVITVTEKEGGIQVRQDRFLETGPADPKDNETIWYASGSLDVVHAAELTQVTRIGRSH